ncbi:MAG: DUF5701 family protein [Nocardioidaceae bacterium]
MRSGHVGSSSSHRFEPIESVEVPPGQAYVVLELDRSTETLIATPDDALAAITAQGRTPLTCDERIAFIRAFPDSLEKNICFSLVAARCGDRRVPASCDGRAGADARYRGAIRRAPSIRMVSPLR